MNLFDNQNNNYVLFSGTSFLDEQDVFRHINDLFFVLFLLVNKGISKENITLAVDLEALEYLDKKTKNKKIKLFTEFEQTYKEMVYSSVDNLIDVANFEQEFQRDKTKNLIFFASGHGNIHGLSIGKTKTFLSPDYFEKNIVKDKITFLYLSQCIAGAFHHLDTRNKIVVLGASEYQSSVSIPIRKLKLTKDHKTIEKLFSFYENIPINPFIYTFFINILLADSLIKRESKNVLNLYKYINSNTIELIKNDDVKIFINISKLDSSIVELNIPQKIVQQPYILNKILATEVSFYKGNDK